MSSYGCQKDTCRSSSGKISRLSPLKYCDYSDIIILSPESSWYFSYNFALTFVPFESNNRIAIFIKCFDEFDEKDKICESENWKTDSDISLHIFVKFITGIIDFALCTKQWKTKAKCSQFWSKSQNLLFWPNNLFWNQNHFLNAKWCFEQKVEN